MVISSQPMASSAICNWWERDRVNRRNNTLDPLAMGLYALSIQPLITSLQAASSVKQCWFADDASGAGSIMEIRTWWDALSTLGPDFGYFPNDRKCWIIAKPAKEESVREAFKDTSINVTVQGQKHLGRQ